MSVLLVLPDVVARRLNDPLPEVPATDLQSFAFSADGEQLAYFVREPPNIFALHVARHDGSVPPLRVAEVVGGLTPSLEFTPDGSQVLYRSQGTQLSSVPADGSAPPFAWGSVQDYAVSPDSERLVYIQDAFTVGRFLLLSAPLDHSSGPVVLNGGLVAAGDVHAFVLSPDGTRVAYHAEQVTATGLYSAPIDTPLSDVLLSSVVFVQPDFVVDPGGTFVVFRDQSIVPGRLDLFSVPLDGSAGAVVLSGVGPSTDDVAPGFEVGPDGTRVAYLAGSGLYSNLLTGGTPTLLAAGPVAELALAAGGERVVCRAELDTAGVVELYTVPIDGSAPAEKLSGPLATGEDVLALQIGPDGSRAGFTAGVPTSARLFSVPVDAAEPAVEIDAHLATTDTFTVHGSRIVWQRAVVDGSELRSAPVAGGPAVTLNRGEIVWSFAVSPDELDVAFAGDDDVDGVVELFLRPIGATTPATRVSHPFAIDSLGSTVPAFRVGETYAVYLSDADASGVAGVFSASPRHPGPPLRISDQGSVHVDALGSLELAEGVGRALFRGAFVNREWLFSASLDRSEDLVVLNASPPIDGRITSYALGPGGAFAVFLGDQEVDDVFELYAAPTDVQGVPVKLSGPLTAGGDVLAGFQVSPDGTRVLYVADQDTDNVFELYCTDGTVPMKLSGPMTGGGDVLSDPIFSPDGSRVYYRADQDVNERVELYMAPADGSAAPVALSGSLILGGDVLQEFLLTPDGSLVVFLADALVDARYDLFSTPADGSGSFRLQLNTTPAAFSVSDAPVRLNYPIDDEVYPLHYFVEEKPGFQITADGARVVYLALRSNVIQLWSVTIDRAGGAPVRLNAPVGSGNVSTFQLDPTGESVAYIARQGFGGNSARELFLGPMDRSRVPRRIDTSTVLFGGCQDDLEFSTDGRSVLYRIDHEQEDATDLFAAPVRGPFLGRAPTSSPTPR